MILFIQYEMHIQPSLPHPLACPSHVSFPSAIIDMFGNDYLNVSKVLSLENATKFSTSISYYPFHAMMESFLFNWFRRMKHPEVDLTRLSPQHLSLEFYISFPVSRQLSFVTQTYFFLSPCLCSGSLLLLHFTLVNKQYRPDVKPQTID